MVSKSKEFIIPLESINDIGKDVNIFDKISELGINPLYVFCSDKSKKLFGKSTTEDYYHQIFFHYVLQDGQRAHCAWDKAR